MSQETAINNGGSTATIDSAVLGTQASERAGLYRLLASLYRTEPGIETLETLRDENLRQALQEAGMKLEEQFYTATLNVLRDELAVDFANLFLIPGRLISPHESVQLKGGSGLLRGPETAHVRDYYEYTGFKVDEHTPMEPDHISIELEFLGHLASIEAHAWELSNHAKSLDALRYQDDFLRRHLGRWVYDFLDRVKDAAETNFYRELAHLTNCFLAEQDEMLPGMISKIQDVET